MGIPHLVLIVVQARFVLDWSRPEWIEDELVRAGARDARMTDTDSVAVTVAAESYGHAKEVVCALLRRLGASGVAIGDPALVGQR